MSLKKVILESTWNTLQKTTFGATVALCVSTTCHYGVELHDAVATKASETWEQTKDTVATSWGYELPHRIQTAPKQSILELVDLYANAEGVSADLVLATMNQESGGQITALSTANAVGLMQVTKGSGKYFCHISNPDELLDPETNIRCGVKILKSALVQTDWNIQSALQVYNLGRVCVVGGNDPETRCPTETINHGRLIMSRLGKSREKWNKVKG